MIAADLNAIAHAKLETSEIAALERCTGANVRHFRAGEALVRTGERGGPFFVVRSGEVAIIDETTHPPRAIAVLAPGEFTGDMTTHGFADRFDVARDIALASLPEARCVGSKSRERRLQPVSQIGGAAAGPFDFAFLRIDQSIDLLDERALVALEPAEDHAERGESSSRRLASLDQVLGGAHHR